MSSKTLCRLCITSCQEFKCLIDDNDQTNRVYEIAVKYFDPKMLRPKKDQTTAAICIECWRHINEFHTFQQTVINTQLKLEYSNSIIDLVKFDDHLNMDQISSANELVSDDSLPATSQNQELSPESIAAAPTKESCLSNDPAVKINDMDALIFKLIGHLECIICNEKFEYYATLREHFLAKHKNEECNVICCGRKYNQRFKLVRHIRRMHNAKDTYPHRCEICSRPFMEHSKLKIHHRQVHKIKFNYDFNCNICGESFQHNAGLSRHVNRRHHKVELILQWFCKECNRLYENFSNLEKHTKRKHFHINLANKIKEKSEPLLYCKLCNKMYKAVSYYLDHMKEDHSNVTLNSGLLSQLQLVQQLVEENQDIFIIDEIMPDELYDTTFDSQNEIRMSPVDIVDVKYENTTISLDDSN